MLVNVGKRKMIARIQVTTRFGVGRPPENLPCKCLRCGRKIHKGQSWRSSSNGEYSIIEHSDICRAWLFVR